MTTGDLIWLQTVGAIPKNSISPNLSLYFQKDWKNEIQEDSDSLLSQLNHKPLFTRSHHSFNNPSCRWHCSRSYLCSLKRGLYWTWPAIQENHVQAHFDMSIMFYQTCMPRQSNSGIVIDVALLALLGASSNTVPSPQTKSSARQSPLQ